MRANYNYIAVTILHLARREFYRMHPGLFHDMVQIHNDRHKTEDNTEID